MQNIPDICKHDINCYHRVSYYSVNFRSAVGNTDDSRYIHEDRHKSIDADKIKDYYQCNICTFKTKKHHGITFALNHGKSIMAKHLLEHIYSQPIQYINSLFQNISGDYKHVKLFDIYNFLNKKYSTAKI